MGHAVEMTVLPQDDVEVVTRPDGPPTRIENLPPEVAYEVRDGIAAGTTFLRNISEPTLTVYAPPGVANAVGVIVVPGGVVDDQRVDARRARMLRAG